MVASIKNIDINKPDFTVDCSTLARSCETGHVFADNGCEYYAYKIDCDGRTIKIGHSSDWARIYGDRVTRQIGNLPGFEHEGRTGLAGTDIYAAVDAFEKVHAIKVHKDKCKVHVWDVTQIFPIGTNQQKPSKEAEDELFNQYESTHKKLPPGNFKDTRPKVKKAVLKFDTLNRLFE